MERCPKCGTVFEQESPEATAIESRMWWTLNQMLQCKRPLYGGLLEQENWKADRELTALMDRHYIKIADGGFVVTFHGRQWHHDTPTPPWTRPA